MGAFFHSSPLLRDSTFLFLCLYMFNTVTFTTIIITTRTIFFQAVLCAPFCFSTFGNECCSCDIRAMMAK
ncbi:hypothetical protein BCR43DRAFT_485388 [Syncephalastrum racemosum]|uniref:Uncharacterized protein n=1 Tax=Syncephalastrum racemosum TaxID=13706 RepID=A0A1X2HMF8_SYNRA|nr:hypothetical protein BCR43DRAFT_485388 [Syncephalastrum racemosum]